MCGRSAPLSDLTSLYMGTSDQCFAKTERQNGSTSQKKACRIPAHERPRSQSPTPENRLPTVNFFIVQAPVAVVRLGAGAHGPHDVDGPASGAFDAQIKGRPFGKHLVAVSAPDLVVVCSLHFLIVLPLRPRIRPDMRLRARGLTVSHKRRRKPCTMLQSSCGAVVRWSYTGPVGELVTPPPLPEHTLTVYASGVTRRNSGGDCLPSLSLS